MEPTVNFRCKQFTHCHSPRLRLNLTLLLALCFCAFLGSGCRSAGKHSSGGFASVVIQGNTPGQIREVTLDVFSKHGYKVAGVGYPNLVFEKQGSRLDNAAYGNWTGSPPWIRVKAAVIPVSEATFRLECKAALVRDKGQAAFEEEIKIRNFQAGPYQKLLDEVAARLNGKPPVPN